MAVLIMVHYRPYLHPKGSANNDTFACWLVHIPSLVPAYILQKQKHQKIAIRMINDKYTIDYSTWTIKESVPFCILQVIKFVFTPSNPSIHDAVTSHNHLSSLSLPMLLVMKCFQSENVSYCLHAVCDCIGLFKGTYKMCTTEIYICGSPGQKLNIIPFHISIA